MSAPPPFWLDRPYAPRSRLSGRVRCDVCVVGGGMGGVAAAWQLAGRGADVVLLEAGTVASGATGRNGGFLIAGAAPMYHDGRERWGPERARAVHAATLAGQEALVAAADGAGAGAEIRRTGLLRLGMDEAEAADVRAHHAALAADGFPAELVEAGALPPALARPGRLALCTPGDGTMDPVAVVRALAAEAGRRGARIHEDSPVTGPPRAGAPVVTPDGRVEAERVVIAADGGLAALVPAAAAVRPRRLNACATAPAPPGLLPQPVYARHGYEYAQQRPTGEIVLGGFSDLDGAASWTADAVASVPVQARLEAYLREELGVTARVTHRWAGVVGYAEDALPRCGPVPGTDGRVLALGGYNGTGVVQAFVAARIVAELITDGGSPDAGLYLPVGAAPPAPRRA
jgi:glycine/D-amino acid oxidase-like deaminating enzyme